MRRPFYNDDHLRDSPGPGTGTLTGKDVIIEGDGGIEGWGGLTVIAEGNGG